MTLGDSPANFLYCIVLPISITCGDKLQTGR